MSQRNKLFYNQPREIYNSCRKLMALFLLFSIPIQSIAESDTPGPRFELACYFDCKSNGYRLEVTRSGDDWKIGFFPRNIEQNMLSSTYSAIYGNTIPAGFNVTGLGNVNISDQICDYQNGSFLSGSAVHVQMGSSYPAGIYHTNTTSGFGIYTPCGSNYSQGSIEEITDIGTSLALKSYYNSLKPANAPAAVTCQDIPCGAVGPGDVVDDSDLYHWYLDLVDHVNDIKIPSSLFNQEPTPKK